MRDFFILAIVIGLLVCLTGILAWRHWILKRKYQELVATKMLLASYQATIVRLMRDETSRSQSLQALIRRFCRALAECLKVSRVGVVLLEPSGSSIKTAELYHSEGDTFNATPFYTSDEHLQILRSHSGQNAYTVDDLDADDDVNPMFKEYLTKRGVKACMNVPIFIDTQLVGFVTCSNLRPFKWRNGHIALVMSIANLAALGIERQHRMQLEQEAQESANRLARQQRILNDMMKSSGLISGDVRSVFGGFTTKLCQELKIDRVSVRILSEGRRTHVLTEVLSEDGDRIISAPRSGKRAYPPPLAEIIKRGPIAIEDCSIDPRTSTFYAEHLAPRRIRAMLHVPVIQDDNVIGVVECSTYDNPRCWTTHDILLATGVSNLVALALERELRAGIEDRLRHASRVKSQFLANVSHEIRTPMNGVMGLTEILGRTELTPDQHELLDLINKSTKSLLTIINDVLDLSRIESGKLTLFPQEFRLADCVVNVARLLYQQAREKELELDLFIDPSCEGNITTDPDRLRQVLINLVGNAIKFTQHGEVSIRVEPLEGSSDRGVRISIRDTGIGIDATVQKKLFEPFEQGDVAISRNFGGTGLGLSISRLLVEMMGGQMKLQSEPGSGTEISFTLPLRVTPSPGNVPLGSIEKRLVLVVAKRKAAQSTIGSYLRSAGAIVVTCNSHHEAIDLLHSRQPGEQPFDAVILHAGREEFDRQEFSRRARLAAAPSSIRLILVSSKALSQGTGKFGFDHVLRKPALREELVESLAEYFSGTPVVVAQTEAEERKSGQRAKLGLNVLVAEDNRVNQLVAAKYLAELGCTFSIAENGSVAVEMNEKQSFDIILMDMRMPEMNGDIAAMRIRDLEKASGRRPTPIIALTANAFETDAILCREAGMDGFLSKPYTSQQLFNELTRHILIEEAKVA